MKYILFLALLCFFLYKLYQENKTAAIIIGSLDLIFATLYIITLIPNGNKTKNKNE